MVSWGRRKLVVYLFVLGGLETWILPSDSNYHVIIVSWFTQDGTVRRIGENCQSYSINLLYKFIYKRFSAGYSGSYIMAVISTSTDITSGSQHK